MLGFTKKHDMIANINDMENTIYFLKKMKNLSVKLLIVSLKINPHLHPLFQEEN